MIQLRIFGTVDLRQTGVNHADALHLQPKRLALLAYLALSMDPCRRDTLLALFWPDLDEEHARNALSQALHRLRRTLGSGVIIGRGAEEVLLTNDVFWCDAAVFAQALKDKRLAEALDLYRGPLLDGFHLDNVPHFEHWLDTERERLRRRACEAAKALAEKEEGAGNVAGAAQWLRRLLELDPDDEFSLQRLMKTLDRLGDRAGVVRAYESFARRLASELELSPSPETQALLAKLRNRVDGVSGKALLSIAVLPFANMSTDPEQEFFCDGVTEEVINALAQVHGLRVAARTSVFRFKHQPVDLQELAQKLKVQTVLEGSVRRAEDKVRITAQLINVADGYHLWSGRYDRPLHDVFAIQDEIAQSIASTLQEKLLKKVPRQQALPPTQNMEAHALYLKGLFHRRKRSPDDLKLACSYFQQAIECDPNYAQAYAALAFTYTLGGWFLYDAFAPHDAYPQAKTALTQALALNAKLPEAHLALGYLCLAYEWDWHGAEQALRQALTLDPNNPNILGVYSSYLVLTHRFEEALELVHHVEAFEPFWIVPKWAKGIWKLAARRYDEAIYQLQQARDMEPRSPVAPLFLGDTYRFTGQLDQALVSYQQALNLMSRQPIILGRLGALYAEQNQPDKAGKILKELHVLSNTRHVLPSIFAGIYLTLKDYDTMFTWLEKAYEERDTTLVVLNTFPMFDAVRSDPRFQALLKRIGLVAKTRNDLYQ